MRKLALFVAVLVALVVYWNRPAHEAGVRDGLLRLALEADPRTLDPVHSTSTYSGVVNGLMHANLMRFDSRGLPEYDAAKYYKVSENGLRYEFVLNEDVRFSDGVPLTSADVVYSLNRLADPETQSPRSALLEMVQGYSALQNEEAPRLTGLKAQDERTVVFRLSRPFAPFLAALAMPQAAIVKKGWDGDNMKAAVSGPFELKEWERGSHLQLEANSFHRRSGNVQSVLLRILKDPLLIESELRSNRLDLAEVKPQVAEGLQGTGFRLIQVEEYNMYYLGMNFQGPVTSNPTLREAIHLAIDRKSILQGFLKKQGHLATGPVPKGLPGFLDSQFPAFNPERAKELIEENGLQGTRLRLAIYKHPDNLAMGQIFESMLEKVGLEVKLYPRDWNGFTQMLVDGEFDLYYRNWVADYPDGDNFLYPIYHSSSGGLKGNYSLYSSPEFDSVIESSRRETDALKRQKLLQKAARIARDDRARVCLWTKRKLLAVSSRLRSFKPRPMYNSNKFLDAHLAN